MASWHGFPPPFGKAGTTNNSKSTSDVGFHSLSLLSDVSLGNVHQYFRATPQSRGPGAQGKYTSYAFTFDDVDVYILIPKIET
jgi:hypothetical protein